MLALIWSIAGAGILLKVAWPSAPRALGVGAYLLAGWVAIIVAVPLFSVMAPAALAWLAFGGVLFSAGAFVYALRRPDPFPSVFGYHEVFHALVVAGVAVHFSLIAFYVLPR